MKKQQVGIEPTLKEQLEKTEEQYLKHRIIPVRNRISTRLAKTAPEIFGKTGTDALSTIQKMGLLPALNETAMRIRDLLDNI